MPLVIPETDTGTGNPVWIDEKKYSPSKKYAVGEMVRYGTGVYACIVAITTPEPWNPDHWSFLFSVSSGGGSGGAGSYSTKTCKLIIQYDKNGASGTPPSDQTSVYSGEKKEVTLKETVQGQGEMTWTNHYFLGWSEDRYATEGNIYPGYIEKQTWAAESSGIVTIKLWAIWSSTGRIIYKPGEFALEASKEFPDRYQNLPATGTVTLFDGVEPRMFSRKGYTISDWITDDEQHFADRGETISVDGLGPEITIYPAWRALKYTITYKPNDPDIGQSDFVVPNVPFDSIQTISDGSRFQKEGYHVSLWNEKADGTGNVWYPGKSYFYTINRNVTLYAMWSGNEYKVLYFQDEEAALNAVVSSVVTCPNMGLDEENNIVSVSEDYHLALDANNILALDPAVLSIEDSELIEEYSIATYGSPFYTDYRPKPKDNYSFDGWKTSEGEVLTKKDVWMDAYSLGSDATWTRQSDLILYPIWSGKYPFGKIFFGRKESPDYGIIANGPPSYGWPNRPYTHTNIKGKNGDVITDPKYYTNVSKKYDISAYDRYDVLLAANRVSDFLHRYDGAGRYIRLEDSYEPDIYMLGVYEEANELESIVGQAWQTTLEFSCKPQKYLLSGNRRIDIIQTGTLINNPTNYPAFPIVYIWGVGDVNFYGRPTRVLDSEKTKAGSVDDAYLNKTTLTIASNGNRICIDSETFDATNINGDNVNADIVLEDQIVLYPGGNTITYQGQIEKISIIPRWWRL